MRVKILCTDTVKRVNQVQNSKFCRIQEMESHHVIFYTQTHWEALSESRVTFSSAFLFIQVSEELIRVAILWHEMWHEGLEEASRLYFGERNVKGMFAVLEPLHAMMERGPQTLKETSFNQVRVSGLAPTTTACV